MERNITLISHFDINYAVRGIAMIRSAESKSSKSIFWKVLALDSETCEVLRKLNLPNLQIFTTQQVGNELLSIRNSRTYKEFCWSAGAIFMDFVIREFLETDLVAYIDADCYFFGDLATCFSQLGASKNIAAHGHNFSENRKHWEDSVGKFNVGLVLGRKSEELRVCIERWKNQVLVSCTVDTSTGNFGDQKYLDSWPILYDGFIELTSAGVGVAPWNIDNLDLSDSRLGLKVNQDYLIFYHFHGVHQILNLSFFALFQASRGYTIKKYVRNKLYFPYFQELFEIASETGVEIFPKTPLLLSKLDIKNLLYITFFKSESKFLSIF
jgi:hypothetical protein